MDRISDKERRRIAELLAEGAPVWRLHQEINRSRYAIRRAVAAEIVAGRAGRDLQRAGGGRVVAEDRLPAGACPVDGVPGGSGEWRAGPVPGLRC